MNLNWFPFPTAVRQIRSGLIQPGLVSFFPALSCPILPYPDLPSARSPLSTRCLLLHLVNRLRDVSPSKSLTPVYQLNPTRDSNSHTTGSIRTFSCPSTQFSFNSFAHLLFIQVSALCSLVKDPPVIILDFLFIIIPRKDGVRCACDLPLVLSNNYYPNPRVRRSIGTTDNLQPDLRASPEPDSELDLHPPSTQHSSHKLGLSESDQLF